MGDKTRREIDLESTLDSTFNAVVEQLARFDMHGMVFFQFDSNPAKPAEHWGCSLQAKDNDGEEVERRGETINEAAFRVAQVLRGTA